MLKKYLKFIFSITILLVIASGGYFFYYWKNILPYEYWYQLMEKDPKPSNVSLEEYQRKNRQGFCWRDQKYYTPDELKQKAMLSFVENVLLPELNFYKTGEVLNLDSLEPFGLQYEDECKRSNLKCRLWLIPKEYTTKELTKKLIDLHKSGQFLDDETLLENNKVLIHSKDDIAQISSNGNVNKNMLISIHVDRTEFYASDCCTIKSHQEIMAYKKLWLQNGFYSGYPYKGYSLPNFSLQDYGVGNYFLEVTGVVHSVPFSVKQFTYAYFLNNCGDVLFKPYYWRE